MPGLRIEVCKNVYDPREDSYMLAEAVERFAFGKVLDLGTGTGIQGITAAKKGCPVVFADISEAAIRCARKNAYLNSVKSELEFVQSEMFSKISGTFDTIIFNPPYLPEEEAVDRYSSLENTNLFGGADGRRLIDRFLLEYNKFLNANGIALLVESSFNNYENDVKMHGAEIVQKSHYSFEDIVVLLLRKRR